MGSEAAPTELRHASDNHSHQPRPGSARPGPIGLLIRMVLGAVAVYALVELVTKWDIFRDQNLIESDFWFVTVLTVCLLADVFNIALRRRWGVWPIVVFLPAQRRSGRSGTWPQVRSGPLRWPRGCTRATCWSLGPSRCRSRSPPAIPSPG
jgi:hypothetical protein